MKQIKAFGPQDLRMVTSEVPTLAAEEVLIDMKACGICGSDKWFWFVDGPHDYVAGHEVAGEVTAVGAGVRHLQPGDRVAVNNVKGCGTCTVCLAGQFVRCPNGITHMGFGFSEKIAVPERNCLKLDSTINCEVGSLIFDNWGTPYSAISRTSMKSGDYVVVIGCGPIGLAAVRLAKLRGAIVAAVDPIPARLEAAQRQGAAFVSSPNEALASELMQFTKQQGADIVIECSGKSDSYKLAFSLLAIGSTLVSIGEGARFELNSSDLIHKHITVVASLYSTMEDGEQVQRLIVNGDIDPMAFVTHKFKLDDVPTQFGKVIEYDNGLLKSMVIC
ncbi:threonine dehydrogenase-like Zn-dependent dehydrogenase [Paenibacillus castaneae]|uniref:zinc-dependent alcohol dehydrogenase n=1 Tax=Paenibacillus castaneae TaxID=474957 RepID=UPI00141BE608|nr:zinc-binding dehydrogenase [Paenibacillus castaneae]NIK79182.1 threonine dehydrogenase-like Zn-dependent dehydrogenase [Paenibacillus castaneae]